MAKGVVLFLILILLIPLVYSISIKELISRYVFSTATPQMDVINYTDFMVDKDNNGINDTLIFELTTNNNDGSFIFVINLLDRNGILTNAANKTLNSGVNKLNITFDSLLLSQPQFNYSIKIYNSSYSLKYRKDNILTQSYQNYEEGFRLLGVKDSKSDKTLIINATLNSSINGIFETILFLSYNNSVIFAKENKTIVNSAQDLLFNFNDEIIKRTHSKGNFEVSSIKIGKKSIKTDFTTSFYDFRDFASKSYILDFSDKGIDTNNNNKYNFLQINPNLQIINDGTYAIKLALYDLFDNVIEIKNSTLFLNSGENTLSFNFDGKRIYDKKLNGPFIVKYIELYENGILIDKINEAYTTAYYSFNDFDAPSLPDLKTEILASDDYHYGINNVTINFTFANAGNKHAFNVFTEIFDNSTFFNRNNLNLLNINSQITYQFNFTNISDFEVSAIADLQNLVEESNESNNAEMLAIKLNKKPNLTPIENITVNETKNIIINLSASDPNNDNLTFSINSSKFSKNNNIFEWNTTSTDSGNYTLMAAVSDGFLNDSIIFNIVIIDVPVIEIPSNDLDKDGIDDSIDRLIGDKSFINTSTINLTIFVDGSSNLSFIFNKSSNIKFFDSNLKILEFNFDFSKYRLNLTNTTINKQLSNQKGSLLVKGLNLPVGTTKTMYVDKINKSLANLCIKDTQIENINNISSKCNLKTEVKIACNGKFTKTYTCTYNATTNKYKVERLKNSGIIQIK